MIHVRFLTTSIPDGDAAFIVTEQPAYVFLIGGQGQSYKENMHFEKRVMRGPKFISNKISGCSPFFYIYDVVDE